MNTEYENWKKAMPLMARFYAERGMQASQYPFIAGWLLGWGASEEVRQMWKSICEPYLTEAPPKTPPSR